MNARDRDGETPLILAAQYNPNSEVITTLLKSGADVNTRDTTMLGWTALMYAADGEDNKKNPEVITALLKAGADISARAKDGKTALICANLRVLPEP